MQLQELVTVITGASRGIGRALALGFAREGARVLAVARTATGGAESLAGLVHEITDRGGEAVACQCDVSQEGEVQNVIARALSLYDHIDVIVNNAGVAPRGTILQLSADEWDEAMAVNVRGPFLVCKYALPSMMQRQRGSIVNITSMSSLRYAPRNLAYGSSKAALNRFTLNLAEELRPYNIAVNALTPGLIHTRLEATRGPRPEDPRLPAASAEVVVPAAVWLAQQNASTFTGHIVDREEFGRSWP